MLWYVERSLNEKEGTYLYVYIQTNKTNKTQQNRQFTLNILYVFQETLWRIFLRYAAPC